MRVAFCGQVPKDPVYPESNEDFFEINLEAGRIAVSDGASESFDSKTWAKLLVSEFIRLPEINSEWVQNVVDLYAAHYDIATLSWSKLASFDRGSFATLIGVEFFKDRNILDILTIGDSLCAVVEGETIIQSFPYTDAEEFKQRPELLCTRKENNEFIGESGFYIKHLNSVALRPEKEITVLLMTDALAEWTLRLASEGNEKWRELLSIRAENDLQNLVLSEREEKRMRVDDVTLLVLDTRGDDADELPQP